MVTQHSKQMPMPQSGPRASPFTEFRKAVIPASKMAAATVLPRGTVIGFPFTFTVTVSGMGKLRQYAGGQVWIGGYGRSAPQNLARHQRGCSERRSDT